MKIEKDIENIFSHGKFCFTCTTYTCTLIKCKQSADCKQTLDANFQSYLCWELDELKIYLSRFHNKYILYSIIHVGNARILHNKGVFIVFIHVGTNINSIIYLLPFIRQHHKK